MNGASVNLSPDSTSVAPPAGMSPARAATARAAAAGGCDDDGEEDETWFNGPAMVQDLVKETEAALQRLDQLHPAFSLAASGISEAMKTRRTLTMQNVQQYCAFDAIGASMEDSGTERSPTADMVRTAEWASWCVMDCEEDALSPGAGHELVGRGD